MLGNVDVQPMIPVRSLEPAEKFYAKTLGLREVERFPGVAVIYESGNSRLGVYTSEFAGTNKGTAAVWNVSDVEGVAAELKGKGVTFEHYDHLPGLSLKGDVHFADGLAVAWFKDPDGNILSIQNGG